MSNILELFLVYERTDFNNNEDFGLIAYYVEKIIINAHFKMLYDLNHSIVS